MNIEQIYNLYFKDVYRYLYSQTKDTNLAEDITQDTFLKALKNIEKYDGSKDIRAWLFTIARNTLYTHYKREKIYTPYDVSLEQSDSSDLLESMIRKETAARINKILHNMSEPYRNIFILRHYGELSYDEISAMYDNSSSWARITYYRAKKKILEEMENNNHG